MSWRPEQTAARWRDRLGPGADAILDARGFAERAHAGQRYGDAPYVVHLDAAAENLWRHGHRAPELLIAGLLHDTLEDTDATDAQLRGAFGDRVVELVAAVTDAPGRNRRERAERTYPKIAAVPGAVLVKLADRIANVENCWSTRDGRLFMYHREYRGFRKALRRADDETARAMWARLDALMGWRR